MLTGAPVCKSCGMYIAWCGGCPYPKTSTSSFLENRIKILEDENLYLKERVEMLQSFHADTCEVISGGMKCSCHLLGVK